MSTGCVTATRSRLPRTTLQRSGGLPDFVFLAWNRGRRLRHPGGGDGILVVGQVKGRETPTDDPDKERRGLDKNTAAAIRQGNGTIRKLKAEPRQLTNLRNRSAEIDGNAHRWLVVVVLDHDKALRDAARGRELAAAS